MYFANWPDGRVLTLLETFEIDESAEQPLVPPAEIRHEIKQYGKRRCDVEASRDNLKYHLGYAFEAHDALDFPSLALTGLLAMEPGHFSRIFDDVEEEDVDETVLGMLRYALAKPDVLAWCTQMGVWLQWKRLEVVYHIEVTAFKKSDAFKRSGWRRKSATSNQRYLIGQICRILDIPVPKIVQRGQAFNFIDSHGGNPRFWIEPAKPAPWGAEQ